MTSEAELPAQLQRSLQEIYARGDAPGLERACEEALRGHPRSGMVWSWYAWALVQQGRRKELAERIAARPELVGADPLLLQNFTWVLNDEGRFSDSREVLRRFEAAGGAVPDAAWVNLSNLFVGLKELATARKYALEGLRKTGAPVLHHALAEISAHERKPEEVLEQIFAALDKGYELTALTGDATLAGAFGGRAQLEARLAARDAASAAKREEATATLRALLVDGGFGALSRPALRPVVEEGEGVPGGSKLGGAALLRAAEAWPTCGSCGAAMPLFLQLSLADLPERARWADGRVQLFYCLQCNDAGEPGANALARLLPPDAPLVPAKPPPLAGSPAPRRLVGFTDAVDFPDLQDAGEKLRDWLEAAGLEEDYLAAATLDDDKLGGWPRWGGGGAHALPCPDCADGAPLRRLVFQFVSGGALDFQWGDCGTAYLLGCERHPARLALRWSGL